MREAAHNKRHGKQLWHEGEDSALDFRSLLHKQSTPGTRHRGASNTRQSFAPGRGSRTAWQKHRSARETVPAWRDLRAAASSGSRGSSCAVASGERPPMLPRFSPLHARHCSSGTTRDSREEYIRNEFALIDRSTDWCGQCIPKSQTWHRTIPISLQCQEQGSGVRWYLCVLDGCVIHSICPETVHNRRPALFAACVESGFLCQVRLSV